MLKVTDLQAKLENEPDDVLLFLLSDGKVAGLLKEEAMSADACCALVRLVAKALGCTRLRQGCNNLLANIEPSAWFTRRLPSMICQREAKSDMGPILADVVFIFKTLFEVMPSKTLQHAATFASLEKALGIHAGVLDEKLSGEFEACLKLKETIEDADANRATVDEAEGCEGKPPEDYRTLNVYPSVADFVEESAFLRRNKQVGGYESIDDYLDTQFRLLKEDFVAPLREGIDDLRVFGVGSKRFKHGNQLRVYEDVHSLATLGTDRGVCYKVQFSSAKFKRINWEASKRLIFGSLVALSRDNFETALFATVADRDPKMLKDGIVSLKFVDGASGRDKRYFHTSYHGYLMVETTAYFEAYVHVLKGLQFFDKDNFPFEKYIVKCCDDVSRPRYLAGPGGGDFDVSSICGPLAKKKLCISDVTPENLKMDDSQYNAVRVALTNEFALIQGPPGTGKTFVGLKVAKVLLNYANGTLWNKTGKSQMLVVCYTNHALDQFLEGILVFHERHSDIVRVGSRSNSEAMQSLSLKIRKRDMRKSRSIPKQTFRNLMEAKEQMGKMKLELQESADMVDHLNMQIIHAEEMASVIAPRLMSQFADLEHRVFDATGRRLSAIVEWLGYGEVLEEAAAPGEPLSLDAVEDDGTIRVYSDVNAITADRLLDDARNDAGGGDAAAAAGVEHRFASINLQPTAEDGGWETVKGSKKSASYQLKTRLRSKVTMDYENVVKVENIWLLDMEDRWRLYRHWVQAFKRQLLQKAEVVQVEFEKTFRWYEEMSFQEELHVLRSAKIIGMTTTGAARYTKVLQDLDPKIVIIEEAAEVLEGHIVTSLSRKCEHLILIGDHKQLRPNPTVFRLAKDYKLDISLFERMINNQVEFATLGEQHRMRPQISKMMLAIYPDLKDHPSVKLRPNVRGVSKNLFFFNHEIFELHEDEQFSHSNGFEAGFAAALCRYFLLQGYEGKQITILTLYSGQLFALKRKMPRHLFEGVRVTSVDNYQGEENDIVILSLVRSNDKGSIGFVGVENRICVALSRAKCGLYVIGNFEMFSAQSPLWNKLVRFAKTEGVFGERLELSCQNHPEDEGIAAACEADFQKAPEGGCMKPCEYRLECGHVCPKVCHPLDQRHDYIKCSKPCPKECGTGHRCQSLCSQPCAPCTVMVQKAMPRCGHVQRLPCSVDPTKRSCKELVARSLPCGHTMRRSCGDMDVVCTEPCGTVLKCGHPCKGDCAQCSRGRLHQSCRSKCTRYLICEHKCAANCSNCPPCRKKCETRCFHSKCQKACGEECKRCEERCSWECEHQKCEKLCWEVCERPRCDEGCKKKLECGHGCIGLCGEPCPKACRICNKELVEEIFFGTEDEEDAKFVQLADCKHFFEVTGLDTWIAREDNDPTSSIALKKCPKCKTRIENSVRYGNEIKKVFADVNKIKAKHFGNADRLEALKMSIKEMLEGFDETEFADLERVQCLSLKLKLTRLSDPKSHADEMTLTSMHNLANALKAVCVAKKEVTARGDHDGSVEMAFRELQGWILKQSVFSEQTEIDFMNEVKRLRRVGAYLRMKRERMSDRAFLEKRRETARLDEILLSGKRLGEADYKEINDLVKALEPKGLNISESVRMEILKAMGMRKGHWYKCPNGHIYCITECGGAMVESRCPECGATIGGGSHRLRSDNAVATEMDGARHGAWSEQANMNNYDLGH